MDRAYTANQFGNGVSVIDVASNTTEATIPLSDGGFNVLAPPNGRVYVTTASGTLHVIAAATRQVLATIPVGAATNGLAFDRSAEGLYVSARDAAQVSAIDARTNAVKRVYQVSAQPQRIALSSDGTELYIATESAGLEVLNVAPGARALARRVQRVVTAGANPDMPADGCIDEP